MEERTEQKQDQKDSGLKKFAGPALALLIVAGAGYWAVASGRIDISNFVVSKPAEDLVAKVNGEGIEKRILDARFEQTKSSYEAQGTVLEAADAEQLKQQLLDDMIAERLLVQYGKEQGIAIENQAVEDEYQQAVAQFGGEEELAKQLALQNITLQDIRAQIAEQMIIQEIADQKAAENNIEVSEEEIQQVYDDAAAGGAELPGLEEVRGDIEGYIRQQKTGEIMQTLVDQLRKDASVEILS